MKPVMFNYQDPLVTNADMSVSVTGSPIDFQYIDDISCQMNWSGSNPIGTITFQASLDYNPHLKTGTWTQLSNLVIEPDGVSGNGFINFNQLSAPWLSIVFTTQAGASGSLNVMYGGKML